MARGKKNNNRCICCCVLVAAVASCLEKRESENCGEELSERVEDKKKFHNLSIFCFSFFFYFKKATNRNGICGEKVRNQLSDFVAVI